MCLCEGSFLRLSEEYSLPSIVMPSNLDSTPSRILSTLSFSPWALCLSIMISHSFRRVAVTVLSMDFSRSALWTLDGRGFPLYGGFTILIYDITIGLRSALRIFPAIIIFWNGVIFLAFSSFVIPLSILYCSETLPNAAGLSVTETA